MVKRLALDLSSEHDLTVCEIEPRVGLYTDGTEPAWDSLSPSLSATPPFILSLFLSLKINTSFKKPTGRGRDKY